MTKTNILSSLLHHDSPRTVPDLPPEIHRVIVQDLLDPILFMHGPQFQYVKPAQKTLGMWWNGEHNLEGPGWLKGYRDHILEAYRTLVNVSHVCSGWRKVVFDTYLPKVYADPSLTSPREPRIVNPIPEDYGLQPFLLVRTLLQDKPPPSLSVIVDYDTWTSFVERLSVPGFKKPTIETSRTNKTLESILRSSAHLHILTIMHTGSILERMSRVTLTDYRSDLPGESLRAYEPVLPRLYKLTVYDGPDTHKILRWASLPNLEHLCIRNMLVPSSQQSFSNMPNLHTLQLVDVAFTNQMAWGLDSGTCINRLTNLRRLELFSDDYGFLKIFWDIRETWRHITDLTVGVLDVRTESLARWNIPPNLESLTVVVKVWPNFRTTAAPWEHASGREDTISGRDGPLEHIAECLRSEVNQTLIAEGKFKELTIVADWEMEETDLASFDSYRDIEYSCERLNVRLRAYRSGKPSVNNHDGYGYHSFLSHVPDPSVWINGRLDMPFESQIARRQHQNGQQGIDETSRCRICCKRFDDSTEDKNNNQDEDENMDEHVA